MPSASSTVHQSGGLLASAIILVLAGCGQEDLASSQGLGGGSTGELLGGGNGGAVGVATASFLVLDLSAGTYVAKADVPDLTTNPIYKDGSVVFKRVTGLGSDYFIGAYEMTQAQWIRLAGSSPWASVPAAVVPNSAVAPAMPAFSLSYDHLTAGIAAYNLRKGTKISVPSGAQWLHGCASGSAGTWSWGDTSSRVVVENYAVVAETLNGTRGPRTAGGRLPNAFGLYDMHGNVAEWTLGGTTVRGGSWFDGVNQSVTISSSGAAEGVTSAVDHALVGARLTLTP